MCSCWTIYMCHGPFAYTVTFKGSPENSEDFDEYEALKLLTVQAVSYDGLGDATN